jgi:hypothetical protein
VSFNKHVLKPPSSQYVVMGAAGSSEILVAYLLYSVYAEVTAKRFGSSGT